MLLGVDVLLNGLRKRQFRSSAAFAFAGEVFRWPETPQCVCPDR